ncbi:single-stranded-DNA-specific exonuclease RecJ [Thalassospiraceae bacterium LMO-JJ14]|nr:single-stranded-DNA-specific exonuclease RecJ [Thalassospiraceae bacterium LMO-JJ14]
MDTIASGVFSGVENSVSGRRWVMRDIDERAALAMSQSLGLSDITARALTGRGIGIEDAEKFLAPTLKDLLPDPSRFVDMDKAAVRLADAVLNNEKIALFADYDVDGATSSAVLARFLRTAGAEPLVYIPDRIKEGYGPSVGAMQKLAGQGIGVVIALDCGTTAFDALKAGKDAGLDIVVIDHHEAEPQLPDVLALVNPNRMDEDRVYGHLCTAGLAFLYAVAINRELRKRGYWTAERPEPVLTRSLDLVALGTVCDVVKLEGINRAFVVQGLKVMAKRENTGLRALSDVAGLHAMPESYHLGFVLGPRINAGGRIGDSGMGAKLLRTEDPGEAAAIATRLDILNGERREIEAACFEAALQQIEKGPEPGAAVVCADQGWHPGVVGIVASRLVERYHRPACVIAMDGDTGTGSGRSVYGVDLGAAIIAARQKGILIKGGGHAMAAGFSVSSGALDEFRAFLDERISQQTGGALIKPDLRLDGSIALRGASVELAAEIATLAPFGPGNPEPRLAIRNVKIPFADIVGGDHIRFSLSQGSGGTLEGISFRSVGTPLGQLLLSAHNQTVHVAGRLKADSWQGRTRVKFHLEDVALTQASGDVG